LKFEYDLTRGIVEGEAWQSEETACVKGESIAALRTSNTI
jgi:hypothetical protein